MVHRLTRNIFSTRVKGLRGGYVRTNSLISFPVCKPLSLFTQISTDIPVRLWSNLTRGGRRERKIERESNRGREIAKVSEREKETKRDREREEHK